MSGINVWRVAGVFKRRDANYKKTAAEWSTAASLY